MQRLRPLIVRPAVRAIFASTRPHLAEVSPLTVLPEDEQAVRDQVQRFARERVLPLVPEMDKKALMSPDIIQELFQNGLMGIEIPQQHGGTGMNFMTSCLVIEELAKVDAAVAVCVDVQNTLFVNAVMRFGTPEIQDRYLPRLATDTIGSFCLSEVSSGSDAFAMKTSAKPDGDDFILNGSKFWITNAGEAGLFLVLANVDFSKGYKGITAFLIERGHPGLTIGKREDKLGIRASSTCEVILSDCRVHKSQVLGEVGKGYKIAIETLNEGRIGIGAQMVGVAQGAFDYAVSYIHNRSQFGKKLADFQGMQFQYAQAATDIEAARLLVYNAARLKMAGKPFVTEAAMAKLFSSQVANNVAGQCVEWMGGVGFTKEYPIEKFFRDAKIGQIYEGASNLQLQTIAKSISSQYK